MRTSWVASSVALGALAFLYLPMLAVALFSFNKTRHGLSWGGFTLGWYARLAQDPAILEAARNTFLLAGVSTLLATLLGTLFALGLERHPFAPRVRAFLEDILHLPVVTPDLILAAALVVAFGFLRAVSSLFEPGFLPMVIGHVTFQVAFVALVVMSRLRSLPKELDEAARDLYATYPDYLRRVLLPLLTPGIVAGAMLAFTLSLDDFVISFFTAGPTSQTLPLIIYASTRRGITPEIHAVSTLVFSLTLVLVLLGERLTRRSA
ncbi:spermidine/putrescine transport system permease protein [Thermus arciformis]|uniref:Spermidine/putrescine transport system permease protein n=2 Tax=Thermus arciformis TaxID=482827 RepID=A0A1G7F406_9DEIN|nr:ABC transporter permease [Thermus arciformis]SDE70644.1 spermidine/putrescine transport system permease protein [Thermus arciformis]